MELKEGFANVERLLRGLVVAPAALVGAALVVPDSGVGIVLLVVAAVMLGAALLTSCPLWTLLSISTRSRAAG